MLLGGFPPLETGERRVIAVRAHPWVLARSSLPLFGLALLPIPYAVLDVSQPKLRLASLSPVFLWLLAAAFVFCLVKWLTLDLLPWTQRVYVLTDRRLIVQEGVLSVRRRECSLLKIQESDYISRGPVTRLLNLGNVEVQTSGGIGTIVLASVAQPQRVQALISAEARATRDNVAQMRLTERPEEILRQLAAAVDGSMPIHNSPTEAIRAISKRAARTQERLSLLPDEAVVEVTRQHAVVLTIGLMGPALGYVVVATAAAYLGSIVVPFALGAGALLTLWAVVRALSFAAHEYVLTTDRLMELRSIPLFFQTRDIVQLASVQDVALEMPTIVSRLADIGDIIVEVAGPADRVVLKTVGEPARLQKLIFETIDANRRRQFEREDQRMVHTLSRWFQEYHRLQQGEAGPT